MKNDYILFIIFLFIISIFNQCHNKYMNKTVELFYVDDSDEKRKLKQEIMEILERLESYIKVIVNFRNFNNNKFLNEQGNENTAEASTEVSNEASTEVQEPIIEEFINYSIEGCNKDYESSWKEDFTNFSSREEILNYIFMLNQIYDKNISNTIQLKDNLIDMIHSMKKVFDSSTDSDFVDCQQITPNQEQIINRYCVLNDESIDLFTKQKIVFNEDIDNISKDICTLLVKYNDLHHIVHEIRNVNNYYNSIWEDENNITKTNIQFKSDFIN